VTTGRYITVEVLTGSFLGVPWSPWLFPLYDFGVQERIDRGFGVGAHTPMTADVCHCPPHQNSCTAVAQVESNAREPDHSICMVKKVKRGVGIGLTFLRFRVYVYAFAGDTRRYRCFDSLTVAHQSRFTSGAIYTGESPFLMTSRPPSLRKRNSVSGRPCIVLPSLVGIGTNGTHSPASLGSKPTASSSKTWLSGRARVVSYDHGL